MKLRSIKAALLALVAMAMLSTSVKAATYAAGDLLLGFRSTDSSATYDYVIDLGSYSKFTVGGTYYTSGLTLNLGSALNSAFGSDWDTAGSGGVTNVQWGAIGGISGSGVIYATYNGGQWVGGELSLTLQKGIITDAGTVGSYLGSSATTGVQQTAGDTNSWASYSGGAFYYGGNEGSTTDVLTLNQMNPVNGGNGTALGTFTLTSDGSGNATVVYAATPEPTTYALMVLGGFILFWGMKRRNLSLS